MGKQRSVLIHNSMRQDWKSCPRKVYWRTVAGVEPKRKGLALIVGTAFHAGLEAWRKSRADVTAAVDAAANSLAAEMTLYGYRDEEQFKDELAKVTAYVVGYVQVYAGDIALMKHGAWFETKLQAPGEHGTLDAHFVDENGHFWIIDDKTRSDLDADAPMAVALDEQLLNYALLLVNESLGSRPVKGALWRETKKCALRRKVKESAGEYSDRVMAEYTGPTAARLYRETRIEFDVKDLSIYWAQKKNFDKHLRSDVRLRLGLRQPVAMWPHNSGACMTPYGACQYLKLCASRGRDVADFQPTNEEPLDGRIFQQGAWPRPTNTVGPAALGLRLPGHAGV